MPYGEKSSEQLLEYADKIIRFFIKKGAKAIIMACNTTSSVIYDKIKDNYGIKIYPVIQSSAKILSQIPVKRLGVFATHATVSSNAYKKEIQKYNPEIDVVQIACPEWVKIVENNKIEESIDQIKTKLDEMMTYSPDKIILGCTHYPYLLNVLSQFAPKDMFIDPSVYFAQFIKDDLEQSNLLYNSGNTEEIYVSSNPKQFMESAKMFYELKNLPKVIK